MFSVEKGDVIFTNSELKELKTLKPFINQIYLPINKDSVNLISRKFSKILD